MFFQFHFFPIYFRIIAYNISVSGLLAWFHTLGKITWKEKSHPVFWSKNKTITLIKSILTVYCLISCICYRLFIWDHVLKHSTYLAINSSSLKYVFLSRQHLGRQQWLAGKPPGCYCQAPVFHFEQVCVCVCGCVCVEWYVFVCVHVCVCMCLPYETKGMLLTSSCWSEIGGIKEVPEENVRGATRPLSSQPALHRKTLFMIT